MVNWVKGTKHNGGTVGSDPVVQQKTMDAFIESHVQGLLAKRTHWMYQNKQEIRYEGNMANVHILSTLDLSLSDGIHTNSAGNVAIGQRAASAALGGVHGRDAKFRHPDCRQARQTAAARIELRFDHVDERLQFDSLIAEHFPFEVRDGTGQVPIDGWSQPAPGAFRLELARPLRGRAIVVGAPTHCPPNVVPFDISGFRPMLGFIQPVE